MPDHSITSVPAGMPLPADDPHRELTVAAPDDPAVRKIAQAGDIYSVIVPGARTDGRYCLMDMLVPDGGGPPPHRHDFEEMFSLLEGELEFTIRGETHTVRAPQAINIPANAPHMFKNKSGKTVHMLCIATPAGLDEFFLAIAVPVDSRTSPPPKLSQEKQAERQLLTKELAPKYRTEFLDSA